MELQEYYEKTEISKVEEVVLAFREFLSTLLPENTDISSTEYGEIFTSISAANMAREAILFVEKKVYDNDIVISRHPEFISLNAGYEFLYNDENTEMLVFESVGEAIEKLIDSGFEKSDIGYGVFIGTQNYPDLV